MTLVVSLAFQTGCELGAECIRAESRVSFDDPTRYIAVDRSTYAALSQTPEGRGLEAMTEASGVVVLEVDPAVVPTISALAHKTTHRCGGFTAHATLDGALDRVANVDRPAVLAATLEYVIDNQAVAQQLVAEPKEANIVATIEALSAFQNRHHASASGAQASQWLLDFWSQLTASRSDVLVEQISHTSSPQKSVMLTFTGTSLPDEVIILGAHLDSLAGGGGPQDNAPGADDDASGVAVATEIARSIVATGYRPQRTIKLIAYAAEEVGLRGSDEIARAFSSAGTDVAAVMQLDMVNYNGSATDISFIRDRTSDALTNFVASLVDAYLPGVTYNNGTCGYGCSDHASWDALGYPTVYPFEADFEQSNPGIHTDGDTLVLSQNSAAHALKFARLAAAYIAETAKGAIEDTGDETPPDPTPPDPETEEPDACL